MKLRILIRILKSKFIFSYLKNKLREGIMKKIKKRKIKKVDKDKIKKPCKVTVKAANKHSIIMAITSVIVTSILFIVIILPLSQNITLNKINDKKENMIFAARMDMAKKTVDYQEILREIKSIEKNLVIMKKLKYNLTSWSWNRLSDKEFEYTAAHMYFYKVRHHIDWVGFAANRTTESEWNKNCKSRVGARGTDQLMPITFIEMNKRLCKYGNYSIYSVYHNTEAGLHNWFNCREFLTYKLGRKPTVREISMAYNMGETGFIKSYRNGNKKQNYSFETWRHGIKVEWYYNHYKNGKYDVVWEERLLKDLEKKYL
jgi:hypothetical protein